MELGLRPRVVWLLETCGRADAAGTEAAHERDGSATFLSLAFVEMSGHSAFEVFEVIM